MTSIRDDQCRWCGHDEETHKPGFLCKADGNTIVPRLHDDELGCRCRGWEQVPPDQRASVSVVK